MARKNHSDEFRPQAVELDESAPGATIKGIAEYLGIERTTFGLWLDRFGLRHQGHPRRQHHPHHPQPTTVTSAAAKTG